MCPRANSHVSVLQQRLLFAEQNLSAPIYFVENVPVWPAMPLDDTTAIHAARTNGRYFAAQGDDELRRLIAKRTNKIYSTTYQADNVAVTAGAMHALALAFRAVAETSTSGNSVLCIGASFVGVANVIRTAGLMPCFVGGSAWNTEFADVLRAITPATRCIYVNSPHNPTGQYLSNEFLASLANLCNERKLALVADLVYDSYFFDGHQPTLAAAIMASGEAFLVSSVSKNFGIPGARVGWLVSTSSTIQSIVTHLEIENVAISSASQELAKFAISIGNASLVESVARTRAVIRDSIRAAGIDQEIPPSGTQMMLATPFEDVEDFADYALRECSLVLATSSNYEGHTRPFIRLPFSYLPDQSLRALDRLYEAITSYQHANNIRLETPYNISPSLAEGSRR